jgi:hypothetical protein
MIILLALLEQDPVVDFEKYKAAYEPYRQCILSTGKSEYSSGGDFKSIYETARQKCAAKRAEYALKAALIELERAAGGGASARNPVSSDPGAAFDEELVLEVGQDFVPKKR